MRSTVSVVMVLAWQSWAVRAKPVASVVTTKPRRLRSIVGNRPAISDATLRMMSDPYSRHSYGRPYARAAFGGDQTYASNRSLSNRTYSLRPGWSNPILRRLSHRP